MRVLLANTRHFRGGGDSTYVFNLADLLHRAGHDVAFFAMHDARNALDPNSDLFVSNIDFKDMNRNMNILNMLRVVLRVIYSLEAKRKFGRMLQRYKPDFVHLHSIHHHLTPSIIFESREKRIPIVWTLHDYKLICPNSHFMIDTSGEVCEACGRNSYYQAILRRCKKGSLLASTMACIETYVHRIIGVRNYVDMFIAPSSFLRNKLIEKGFPSTKVRHISHFIPDDMFIPSKNRKGNYLLFIGKLEPIKGIYQLLAASGIAREVPVMLAGHAEKSFLSKLGVLGPSSVKYVGVKQNIELRALIAESLGIIVPSLCYENQPFSILEAFACGKPVIASNLGGMAELVKNGERGILVPPGDAEALADAMKWLFNHPGEAVKMGIAAQTYALREHSAAVHYAKLMKVYQGILN